MADIYAAKDALIDLLKAAAVSPGSLTGVDVTYGWDPTSGLRQIYGGGVRFENEDAVAEPAVMSRENGTVSLFIRAINKPAGPAEDTDAAVRTIRAAIEAVLKANPKIGGVWSWQGITSGIGDYSRTDDETTSVLSLQVRFGTYASW